MLRICDDIGHFLNNRRTVECPVCSWTGNRFFVLSNMGHNIWREDLCPKCGCLGRHRLLITYLKEKHNVMGTPLKILDIAPMDGIQAYFKQLPFSEYTSIDLISPRAMIKMDLTNLNFDSDTFDLIMCFHVLEHIENDRKAISEMQRVLKRTGLAVIDVPIDWHMSETDEFGNPEKVHGHYRLYGRDFPDRLRHCGFDVVVESYSKQMDLPIRKRYGIPDINLILARKGEEK